MPPSSDSGKQERYPLKRVDPPVQRHDAIFQKDLKHAFNTGTVIYATNRKVAGSIPAGVSGFFILPIALWPWGRLSL